MQVSYLVNFFFIKYFLQILITCYAIYSDCIALQDPHCGWDTKTQACIPVFNKSPVNGKFLQDIEKGDVDACNRVPLLSKELPGRTVTHGTLGGIARHPVQELEKNNIDNIDNNVIINLATTNDVDEVNNSDESKEKHETGMKKIKHFDYILHILFLIIC